ncbi:MAG: ABC transporter permease, partial [Bacteroidota bacterium]|nr:ABC transporter permease [Bacteroidota bacterium]
ALGGIWVPVYVMPESIRLFAELSPLYWSLSAFHKIFLNDSGISAILPFAIKLLIFFLITIFSAWMFNRMKIR